MCKLLKNLHRGTLQNSVSRRPTASLLNNKLRIILGQQLVWVFYMCRVDDFKNMGEPLFGIDVVQPACSKQDINHCCILRPLMASGKQVVFSSERYGPDGVLDKIIIYL